MSLYEAFANCGKPLQSSDLSAIYEALSEYAFPDSAVEATKKEETRQGYDTTGYKYQYLVNALNEIVGSNHWKLESKVLHLKEDKTKSGRDMFHIAMEITIQFGNWIVSETTDGRSYSIFAILDEKTSYGGNSSGDIGDAIKGAQTNGIKKTLGLFGLGQTAYTGELHSALGLEVPNDDRKDFAGMFGGQIKPQNEPNQQNQFPQFKSASPAAAPAAADGPYSKSICHVYGTPLTAKQMNYCKENGMKPTSLKAINEIGEDEAKVKFKV